MNPCILSTIDYFKIFLDTILTLATIALAFLAYDGLSQWKKELKGTDQYRALVDIKVKLLNFKEKYQNFRLSYIRQITELPEEKYPTLKSTYSGYFDQLWKSYDNLANAINFYRIIVLDNQLFLDKQLTQVYC